MRLSARRLLLTALAGLLLCTSVVACVSSATDAPSYLVVQQNGRVLNRFTLPQLQDLPQLEILTPQSHGAKSQNGPTVRSILDAAGATGVDHVRVEGRDPAQTLSANELTNQLILSVTKRNTLKLTGTQIGTDRWIRDVTTLVVNP